MESLMKQIADLGIRVAALEVKAREQPIEKTDFKIFDAIGRFVFGVSIGFLLAELTLFVIRVV